MTVKDSISAMCDSVGKMVDACEVVKPGVRADDHRVIGGVRIPPTAAQITNTMGLRFDQDAEHTVSIQFNGDFNMAGLLRHMHRLGGIGASRTIIAMDEDDKPVKFGWDGDGADKIVSANVDGVDILK